MKTDDLHIGWMGTTDAHDGSNYLEGAEVVAVRTYLLIVRICEVLSASGFVQTLNELVNGLCV